MRRVVIKEGPLVFIRNVLVMELVAAVLLYVASFLGNYEMLFRSWGLDQYARYDIFLIVIFSVFQLIYILLLFLDWYFSLYEIREREIIRKSGLLFRRRKSVSLSNVTSVEIYQSPLSRPMHHATIILEHAGGRITKIKNVSNFDEHLHIIQQFVRNASGHSHTYNIRDLLEDGEGLFVEFKETLRYDVRKGEVNKEMEHAVLKTIVGFLNTRGGTLVIGVSDSALVMGLDNDYKSLPKKNHDGLENHINMLIKVSIGLAFAKYINVSFEKIEKKEVCIVSVMESHKPAYLKGGDRTEEFFVRVGNSTQPFSMSEAEDYIKIHWK
jgi:membrane protein YdbS with pleckstrin-like domain